jgi:hypothetical protein
MGETFCLQSISTMSGKKTATNKDLYQPILGWCDAKDHRDAVVHVQILRHSPTSPAVKLVIQTATGVAGPWKDLAVFSGTSPAPPVNETFAASTGGTASFQLERFLRWKIDTFSVATDAVWTLCFGICVTLK